MCLVTIHPSIFGFAWTGQCFNKMLSKGWRKWELDNEFRASKQTPPTPGNTMQYQVMIGNIMQYQVIIGNIMQHRTISLGKNTMQHTTIPCNSKQNPTQQ